MRKCPLIQKELAFGIILFLLIPGIVSSYGQPGKEKAYQTTLEGDILYVGGSGEGNYTKIQDAINDSNSGDTIYVYNDSSPYLEHIVIDKSIMLIGEDKFSTEINGSLLENTLDTVYVAGDNVVIEGFRIARNQGYYYQASLKVVGDYLTVSNCSIYDNEWIGIYLVSASFCRIIDCELYENLMALNLVNSRNNIIMNCSFYDNAESITLYQSSDHNQILHSMCNRSSFTGIHIQQSSENQITDCLCQNGYGITLAYAPQTKMRNNTLLNNFVNFGIGSSDVSDFYCDIDTSNTINGKPMYYLIEQSNLLFDETMEVGFLGLVNCQNVSVKNCDFTNNFEGMLIAGTSTSRIENCSFHNNEGHGLYIISSMDNIVKNCSFRSGFFDGIFLYNSSNNIVEKCSSYGSSAGVRLESSTHNMIHEQTVDQCTLGIFFISSSNNILKESSLSHCGLKVDGRSLSEYINDVDTSNTVNGKPIYYCTNETNILIPSDAGEVVLVNCTACSVSNLTLSNTSIAIELAYSSMNTISQNTLYSNSDAAIDLDGSDNNNNIIKDNILRENSYGIDVDFSRGNVIRGNMISNNGPGFSFDSSQGNMITGNTIQDCYYGMYFLNSPLNIFSDNTIRNASAFGLYLLSSSENVLKSNEMINCSLMMYGSSLDEYRNNIDTSNTVNGKPLYYLSDQMDSTIPKDAGEVILVNSSGCVIKNLNIERGTIGITLAYSSRNIISENTIKDQVMTGLDLSSGYSDNNTIQGNTFQRNGYGIDIEYCTGNALKYNIIDSNVYGVFLYNAVNTIIRRNTIVRNSLGIDTEQTLGSTIHWNNIFLNNLYGLSVDGCSVSAQRNWWGSTKGPAVNEDGNGDHLNTIHNGQIIIVPWNRLPVLFSGILRFILTNIQEKNNVQQQFATPQETFITLTSYSSTDFTIHGMKNLRLAQEPTDPPNMRSEVNFDTKFPSPFL